MNTRQIKIDNTKKVNLTTKYYLEHFGEKVNNPDDPTKLEIKSDINLDDVHSSIMDKIFIFLKIQDKQVTTADVDFSSYGIVPTKVSSSNLLNAAYGSLREFEKAKLNQSFPSGKIKYHHYYITALIGKKITNIAEENDLDQRSELIEKLRNFINSLLQDTRIVKRPINPSLKSRCLNTIRKILSSSPKHNSLKSILVDTESLLIEEECEIQKSKRAAAFSICIEKLQSLNQMTNLTQEILLAGCTIKTVPENMLSTLNKKYLLPGKDKEGKALYFNFAMASHTEYLKNRENLPESVNNERFKNILQNGKYYDFLRLYFIGPAVAIEYMKERETESLTKDSIPEEIQFYLGMMDHRITAKELKRFGLGSLDHEKGHFSDEKLEIIADTINHKNDLLKLGVIYSKIRYLTTQTGNLAKLFAYGAIKGFITKLTINLDELFTLNNTFYKEVLLDHLNNTQGLYLSSEWQSNVFGKGKPNSFNIAYDEAIAILSELAGTMKANALAQDQKNLSQAMKDIKFLCDLFNIPFNETDIDLLQATKNAAEKSIKQAESEEIQKQQVVLSEIKKANTASTTGSSENFLEDFSEDFSDSIEIRRENMIINLNKQINRLNNGFDRYTNAYINRINQSGWLKRLFSRHGQTGIKNAMAARDQFNKEIITLQKNMIEIYERKANEEILSLNQHQADKELLDQFIMLAKKQLAALSNGNLNNYSYKTYLMGYITKLEKLRYLAETRTKLASSASNSVMKKDEGTFNVKVYQKGKDKLMDTIEQVKLINTDMRQADQEKLNVLEGKLKSHQGDANTTIEGIEKDKGYKLLKKLLIEDNQVAFDLFKHKKLDRFKPKDTLEERKEKMVLYKSL